MSVESPSVLDRAISPGCNPLDQPSSTTFRGWFQLSELSNVERIGHPLARAICRQRLFAAGSICHICHVSCTSAIRSRGDFSTVVDGGQRIKGCPARFDTELSRIAADETLPQPAFTNRRYSRSAR
jgi:hypothetical protein